MCKEQDMNETNIKAVKELIEKEHQRLSDLAFDEDGEPIFIEGYTDKGFLVQGYAPANVVASIMLDYDYPLYCILGEDAPQGMWDELAEKFGLETVCTADI